MHTGTSSSTVEQIGTDSDCAKGVPTYFAWWEFYPAKVYAISSLTLTPGDVVSAEVKYNPSTDTYTASITDKTTNTPFSTTFDNKHHSERSSAEWIAEGPSNDLLTHFTTSGRSPGDSAFYGSDYTSIAATNCAIVSGIGGITGCSSIGAYNSASPSSVYQITMVGAKSGATRASPSALSSTGSFFVTWVNASP